VDGYGTVGEEETEIESREACERFSAAVPSDVDATDKGAARGVTIGGVDFFDPEAIADPT